MKGILAVLKVSAIEDDYIILPFAGELNNKKIEKVKLKNNNRLEVGVEYRIHMENVEIKGKTIFGTIKAFQRK